MRLRRLSPWLFLGLLPTLLVPKPATAANPTSLQDGYRSIFTRRIDDHNYPSIGPGAGGGTILPAAGKALVTFFKVNFQSLFDQILQVILLQQSVRQQFSLQDQAVGAKADQTDQLEQLVTPLLLTIVTLSNYVKRDRNSEALAFLREDTLKWLKELDTTPGANRQKAAASPAGTPEEGRERHPAANDGTLLNIPNEVLLDLLGLSFATDPEKSKVMLRYVHRRISSPAYFSRHFRRVTRSQSNREGASANVEIQHEEVFRVVLEALILSYLELRTAGLLSAIQAGDSREEIARLRPPEGTLSLSARAFSSDDRIIIAPELVYSNTAGIYDIGVRAYLPKRFGVAAFGIVDLAPESRRLVHSLGVTRKLVDDYGKLQRTPTPDADKLNLQRDRVLFSVYGVRKADQAGTADAFDRSSEAYHTLFGGTYHYVDRDGRITQGGFTVSRLLRLRSRDDDSPGIRLIASVQGIQVQDAVGRQSALRPSVGFVIQDRIQSIQLPDDPFHLFQLIDDEQGNSPKKRLTNRQLGLIRWNYQLGLEYFPDAGVSKSDFYQLFLRYRIQRQHPRKSITAWERSITDLTLSIGTDSDHGPVFGVTITKAMRL